MDAAGASGHDAAGSPNSVTKSAPALPQLVAIDDCALSARHVVEDAALDKHVYFEAENAQLRGSVVELVLLSPPFFPNPPLLLASRPVRLGSSS